VGEVDDVPIMSFPVPLPPVSTTATLGIAATLDGNEVGDGDDRALNDMQALTTPSESLDLHTILGVVVAASSDDILAILSCKS
jgi:hypothetical protein